MNFTEICELNDILLYSRSYRSQSSFSKLEFSLHHYYHEANFFSVEELVSNSLVDSPLAINRPDYTHLTLRGENDSIERILTDIEQSFLPPRAETRKRIKELTKSKMLICSSPCIQKPHQGLRLRRTVTVEIEESSEYSPKRSPEKGKKRTSIEMMVPIEKEEMGNDEKIEQTNNIASISYILSEDQEKDREEVEVEERKRKRVEFDKSVRKFDGKRKMSRQNTITVLEDSSKKQFRKLNGDEILENFEERRNVLSFLTGSLLNKIAKTDGFLLGSMRLKSNDREITVFSSIIQVFFFSSSQKLKIPINSNSTVNEVIKTIMAYYMKSDQVDHALMRFPQQPEAYELRCLEDDDDYKPEMSFDPLARDRDFLEYNIDSLAFCEIPNFIPESSLERSQKQILWIEKQKKMDEIFAKKQKNVIEINIIEENFSTMIPIPQESTLKEVFPLLRKKKKFNPDKYIVRALHCETHDNDQFDSDDVIDINRPLKSLKTNKLQLVRRIYADDPEVNYNELPRPEAGFCCESEDSSSDLENWRIKGFIEMNEAQAGLYEEFEVLKIKYSGSKEPRILGINGFSIFNKYKEKSEGGFFSFFNIFAEDKKTKYPERLIESIQDVDFIKGTDTQFFIDFLEPNNKLKRLVFESAKKTASYIITKLRFLTRKKIKKKKRFND